MCVCVCVCVVFSTKNKDVLESATMQEKYGIEREKNVRISSRLSRNEN